MVFYRYVARLFDPLHVTVEIPSLLNLLCTSIRRILEVIDMVPSRREKASAVHLPPPVAGYVEMEGVSFSYGE